MIFTVAEENAYVADFVMATILTNEDEEMTDAGASPLQQQVPPASNGLPGTAGGGPGGQPMGSFVSATVGSGPGGLAGAPPTSSVGNGEMPRRREP